MAPVTSSFKDRAHQRAVRFVASRRRSLPMRVLRRVAQSYLDLDGNRNFVSEMNGETRVVEIIGRAGAQTLFDVGANVGDWTASAHRIVPTAEIHAFEIVPDIYADLKRQVGDLPRVTVNGLGLDAQEGELEVRYYPSFSEGSGIGSLVHDAPHELRRARVVTGDAYCAEHGIEHIDLLKIDVEGAEDRVLQGFERMLGDGAVDAVQFEYGPYNIVSHFLLRDFHELFARHGYRVGRVFPTFVDFSPYAMPQDEDFRGPNFVALRTARADLIAALEG